MPVIVSMLFCIFTANAIIFFAFLITLFIFLQCLIRQHCTTNSSQIWLLARLDGAATCNLQKGAATDKPRVKADNGVARIFDALTGLFI